MAVDVYVGENESNPQSSSESTINAQILLYLLWLLEYLQALNSMLDA